MTSTTSERIRRWSNLLYLLPCIVAISLIACEDQRVVTHAELEAALKAQKTSAPKPETQEQPKSPPTTTAPADNSDEKEAQYFGSTYWDEILTSVYWYPDSKVTHLKFGHREDEIYLCGDHRKDFEPGNRYKLVVTFEPNAPCITNWRIK